MRKTLKREPFPMVFAFCLPLSCPPVLQNLGKVQKLGWVNTLEAHLGNRSISEKVVIGQGRTVISLVSTSQGSARVNATEVRRNWL